MRHLEADIKNLLGMKLTADVTLLNNDEFVAILVLIYRFCNDEFIYQQKKLFTSIKHDLIIGKDMSETCRQKSLIKTLD